MISIKSRKRAIYTIKDQVHERSEQPKNLSEIVVVRIYKITLFASLFDQAGNNFIIPQPIGH